MKKQKCHRCGRKTLVHRGCLCQTCVNEGVTIIVPIEQTDYVGFYKILSQHKNDKSLTPYVGSAIDHARRSK